MKTERRTKNNHVAIVFYAFRWSVGSFIGADNFMHKPIKKLALKFTPSIIVVNSVNEIYTSIQHISNHSK